MRILAIGDPHGDLGKIKEIFLEDIDLILLTGDLGSASLMRKMFFENIERKKQGLSPKKYTPAQEKRAFMEAYDSTIRLVRYLSRFAPVYTIFGNVESSNKDTREKIREIGLKLPFLYDDLKSMNGVRVINNVVANFKGVRIGGLEYFVDTNWVKCFDPSNSEKLKESRRQTQKAQRVLKGFGNVDILVCHQPPYGVLDKVSAKFAPPSWQGKHAGSQTILNYIKRFKPRYVFCGHIHEGEGMKKIGKTMIYNLGVAGNKLIEIK
jgi:Icc-related predicted phosphoesterase